jgi:hypothetical protein
MRTYQISGSAKLFSQDCQVPFLMWNKHFQEVTDMLVTPLKEIPVPKRSGFLENIKSRLAINAPQATKRTLKSHTHEWLLLLGNLQRVLIITHPK